jgi:hypothetical protein
VSITKDEIAQLCAAHDRFMAEQASEPMRRLPVSETDAGGLIFKDYDNNALQPAPQPESEPFDAAQREVLAHVVAQQQDHEYAEREKALAPLKQEIAELRGQVSALLTLLGKTEKAADIVELPNWRGRGVA